MRRRQFERLMEKWDEESRRRDEESQRRDAEFREWREQNRKWWADSQRRHEEWWAEWRAYRAEEKRRLDAIDAAIETDKRMTREILVQMREDRRMMRDMRHGIQTTTEGLLRVLDEFRRGDGPSAAGA